MKIFFSLFLLSAIVFSSVTAGGHERPIFPLEPQKNLPHIRLAYYQGGDYKDYLPVFVSILSKLKELGWVEPAAQSCLEGAKTVKDAWACLSARNVGIIEFASDAFWDVAWNKSKRPSIRKQAIERLNKGDIALVLAMGTWAGQDLANNEHATPTVVASCSNALSAGVIKSVEDSGYDHVHARVDPTRYARQIRLFHEIFPFKRLGIVYEDSPEGRTYAGVDQIEKLPKELGFELATCFAPFSGVELAVSEQAVKACCEQLAPQVDGFYLTTHRGFSNDIAADLLDLFIANKTMVFSMGTDTLVEQGALFSIAMPEFYWAGDFLAETIARILNGAKPRSLKQIFEDPHQLVVNTKTAEKIGFRIPIDILCEAKLVDR